MTTTIRITAVTAGVSVSRVHQLTGLARTTITRIIKAR
jgi:hypothetical protein